MEQRRPAALPTALLLGVGVPGFVGSVAFGMASLVFTNVTDGTTVALLGAMGCAGSALLLSGVGISSQSGRVGVALLAGVSALATFSLLTQL